MNVGAEDGQSEERVAKLDSSVHLLESFFETTFEEEQCVACIVIQSATRGTHVCARCSQVMTHDVI